MQTADLANRPAIDDLSSGLDAIDFENFSTVIVALSGGRDSMATLVLTRAYLARHHPDLRLLGITVDHGLRDGSSAEADHVGTICERLGIEHEIVKWSGPKPRTAIQEKAREARYHLIGGIAQQIGRAIVLTGHTADDNQETIKMRRQRSLDQRSPTGISQMTLYDRCVWFVRPMLKQRKSDLSDYLIENSIEWVEDPSNNNMAFERVAVRNSISANDEPKFDGETAELDIAQAASLILDQSLVSLDPGGQSAIFSRNAYGCEGFATALSAVSSLIGKTAYMPNLRPHMAELEGVFLTNNRRAFTFSGCLYQRFDEDITITPEKRNTKMGQYGFDFLVTLENYPIAQAVLKRMDKPLMASIPAKDATS